MATEGINPDGTTRKRTDQLARAVYNQPTTSETSESGYPQPKTQLTLFAEDSRASPSASPANGKPKTMTVGYGQSSPEFLASFDPDTWLLKTSQACVLEGWTTFSETLPKSGTMRNGRVYRLPTLELRTAENEFGLWPTPSVPNGGRLVKHATQQGRTFTHDGKKVQFGLEAAVKMWPTPSASTREGTKNGGHPGLAGGSGNRKKLYDLLGKEDGKKMGCQSLNPYWVEWLQGFPLGWTDLSASETPSSPNAPTKSSSG